MGTTVFVCVTYADSQYIYAGDYCASTSFGKTFFTQDFIINGNIYL